MALEQRRWPEAEEFCRKALTLYAEFNDRYEQAGTYHRLGTVAPEQRRWPEAEEFYRKALTLYVEFNDRYSQASTYHQLGRVAQEQRRWPEAEEFYLKALTLFRGVPGSAPRDVLRCTAWLASGRTAATRA